MTHTTLPRLAAMLTLLSFLASCAATTAPPAASLAGIEDAERARFAAWVKGDVAALAPLLAEDLRYCHSTGVCQTKAELLQAMGSGTTVYRAIDVIEMHPRSADGAAIINGVVAIQAASNGNPIAFKAVYTDVYVRRDGRWLLTAWQSTQLPK